MKAGKLIFASLPGVITPVHEKETGVPPSIVYSIVAEVRFEDPLFLNVTVGVIEPGQLSPNGERILIMEASLTAGGVHASELIKEARIGLFSITVLIRIF